MKNAPRAILSAVAALATYLIWHLIFLIRFGRINTDVNVLDLYFILAAFALFLFVFFMRDKLPGKRQRMWLTLVAALTLPVSLFGALLGGLIGPVGIVAYMLLPMVITLSMAYAILHRR